MVYEIYRHFLIKTFDLTVSIVSSVHDVSLHAMVRERGDDEDGMIDSSQNIQRAIRSDFVVKIK